MRLGRRRSVGVSLIVLVLVAFISYFYTMYRNADGFDRVKKTLVNGRPPLSPLPLLEQSLKTHHRDEAHLLMGICLIDAGRTGNARTAWEAIPVESQLGSQAAMELARLELSNGRLGASEPSCVAH